MMFFVLFFGGGLGLILLPMFFGWMSEEIGTREKDR